MPHVSSSGGEDLASTDEVKVYNDEGEQEELQRTNEDISEVKLGLVTETEQGQGLDRHDFNGKNEEKNGSSSRVPAEHELNPFYFYPYTHNGASVGKLPALGGAFDPLQPLPAHTGLPLLLDKTDTRPGNISPALAWLHRQSLFQLPGASAQYPSYFSDLAASVQSWPGSGYPVSSGIGIRSPYSGLLAAARGYQGFMQSPLSPGMSQPALVTQANKHDFHPHMLQENRFLSNPYGSPSHSHPDDPKDKKKIHIKKPLNAFMLFMKDMRAKVVSECTLKESAAINQILGRKWHALDRAEQAKYYEMAKKERELHLKLYPGWSARDNYAMHSKRKKRRRESQPENKECSNPKKCRARFGLDQQSQWCKPCRRKKKCIRFMTGDPDADEHSDKEDDDIDSQYNSSLGMPSSTGPNGNIDVDSDTEDSNYDTSEDGASGSTSPTRNLSRTTTTSVDQLNANSQTFKRPNGASTIIPAT